MYQFGMALPQNRQEAIRWFDKASDQANYFANHLKARNSYVGFRNDEGRDAVVGFKLRMTALNIEPVGRTFQNSSERMAPPPPDRQASRLRKSRAPVGIKESRVQSLSRFRRLRLHCTGTSTIA